MDNYQSYELQLANKHLLEAAIDGDWPAIEEARQDGANINHVDENGRTALHLAIIHEHSDVAMSILDVDGIDFETEDINHDTPLRSAIEIGRIALIRKLVTSGADLRKCGDERGWGSPLKHAVLNHHLEVAQFLLTDCGCKPDKYALLGAVRQNWHDIIKLMLDRMIWDDVNIEMHTAIKEGSDFRTLRLLYDRGYCWCLDYKGYKGKTALHLVCERDADGDVALAQWLVDLDAPILARDNSGKTPYDLSLENRRTQAIPGQLLSGAVLRTDATMTYADLGEGAELVALPECCTICMENWRHGEEIKCLAPCKHVFHAHCIAHWLDTSNNNENNRKGCPLCRLQLDSGDNSSHGIAERILTFYGDRFLAHRGHVALHYILWNANYINNYVQLEVGTLTEKHFKTLLQLLHRNMLSSDNVGGLPLHTACRRPSTPPKIIQYLVELGGAETAQKQDKDGYLPLHRLLKKKANGPKLEAVQCLVNACPWSVSTRTLGGDLPIMLVSPSAPIDVIDFLQAFSTSTASDAVAR